jgi:hypothetical protein
MSSAANALSMASPASAIAFVEALHLDEPVSLPMAAAPSFPRSQTLRTPLGRLFHPVSAMPPRAAGAPLAAPATGSDPAGLRVKAGLDQVYLVGSQLLSFNREVTEERRSAAINSCLLAQLVAARLHPDPTTPEAAEAWHAAYINTLTNIGWALQSGVTARHEQAQLGVRVDKVLLDIVSALVGGGAAAALVAKVIDKLAEASRDDPFITLYQSRTVEENVVEFAAGLASGADAGFRLSVVECAVRLRSVQTQVLFLKWNADSADVDGRRFDLGLSDAVFAAVRQAVERKLIQKARDFVSSLDLP